VKITDIRMKITSTKIYENEKILKENIKFSDILHIVLRKKNFFILFYAENGKKNRNYDIV
jgi:hypothetical protein